MAGTRLAVRFGTKIIVTAGLVATAAFYGWASTTTVTTSYTTIALQMVLYGIGIGLTSAPATEAIMRIVPKAKAGVGSAINDATRLLGGTLGVAIIGSVYASLYGRRLRARLPHGLPAPLARPRIARPARHSPSRTRSMPAAGRMAQAVRQAAASAFIHGLSVSLPRCRRRRAGGALLAVRLLPDVTGTE